MVTWQSNHSSILLRKFNADLLLSFYAPKSFIYADRAAVTEKTLNRPPTNPTHTESLSTSFSFVTISVNGDCNECIATRVLFALVASRSNATTTITTHQPFLCLVNVQMIPWYYTCHLLNSSSVAAVTKAVSIQLALSCI